MPRIARTAVLDVPHPVAPRGNPVSAAPNWIDPTYDAAGNMTLAPKPGDEAAVGGTRLRLTYDGWNHLTRVESWKDLDEDGVQDAGTEDWALVAEYQYNGQNRRITKTVGQTATHFFFNESW